MLALWGAETMNETIMPDRAASRRVLALGGRSEAGVEAFERLLARHRTEFRAMDDLEFEGDETAAIYVVLSGWLAISRSTEDGDRHIVDVALPGEVFTPGSADRRTTSVAVETMTPVTCAVIPKRVWNDFLQDNPEFRDWMMDLTLSAYSRMTGRMLRLGKSKADGRVAYALIELGVRLCALEPENCDQFHIPMTQQQLGDFTGLSAVHVCRTLGTLQHKGIVDSSDHMDIVVRDMRALCDVARIDLDTLRAEIIPAP